MTAKRTTEPRRSEYIKVNTEPEIKERLQKIAKAYGWTLSLLCHEILQEWLLEKYPSSAWPNDEVEEK